MRVIYHSAFLDKELSAGSTFRAVPCKATLKLQREKDDPPYELKYNGTVIDSSVTEIECNEQIELIVRQEGNRYLYVVKPSVQPLSPKNANAYDEFYYEYDSKKTDEIRSIQIPIASVTIITCRMTFWQIPFKRCKPSRKTTSFSGIVCINTRTSCR